MVDRNFIERLRKVYAIYTGGLILLLILLYIGEKFFGLSPTFIGYVFLFGTIAVYAAIGIISRTGQVAEYYVAGRRVPAVFNGMATAADWMSAASFIGMAGALALQGYNGLAFIMGWTGGYVLLGVLISTLSEKVWCIHHSRLLGCSVWWQVSEVCRYSGNSYSVLYLPCCTDNWCWNNRQQALGSSL